MVIGAMGLAMAVLGAGEAGGVMIDYLRGKATEALAQRATTLEALGTPEELTAYQQRRKNFFVEQLGGFPERTPLNPQVVGQFEGDGFRVEKIIYESRPQFFVTATLFLPTSDPPYPGVLVPCGHSANGKAMDVYQRACIGLARNGMAALIYDPIGQGERGQLLTDDGKQRFGSTFEHTLVGVGCILLGTNAATYRIWDGMRGIDYLCSREDILGDRIGCTGNSGGGTLTSYIMALDDRVLCAVPSCYLTSMERIVHTIGPQDAEQNIYGQLAFGMGHADYVIMRAPKPTLICCATEDYFDIGGTWDTFRAAKQFYTKLGFAERVDLVEAPEKHGFSPLLRQGAVRWMSRWLLDVDKPVVEGEAEVLTEPEIQCTPDGQVLLLEDTRSAFDLNVDLEEKLAPERKAFWSSTPRTEALDKVRQLANIRRLEDLPKPAVLVGEPEERDGYRVQRVVIHPEPGMVLPSLLFVPKKTSGEAYLYVNGKGKDAEAGQGGAIERVVREGHLVLAPDVSGTGETRSDWGVGGWEKMFGPDWKTVFFAYLLGKPYLSMRTEDILVCGRFLSGYETDAGRPVHLVGVGEAGPAALHAGALEPDLFASVRLEHSLESWADVVRTPMAENQLINTVHGALRVYDLPDLAATLGDALTTIDPVNALGASRLL